MRTNHRDFAIFDFHDSYIDKVIMEENQMIWYLEAVNVTPHPEWNPCRCSMRASRMKVIFDHFMVTPPDFNLRKLEEEQFEILTVASAMGSDGENICLFQMTGRSDYVEITVACQYLCFEWDGYQDIAWHVCYHDRDQIREFLEGNPDMEWMTVDERTDSFDKELYREITEEHCLYGMKVHALAKSEESDDVLFALSNSKFAIVHLTYMKETDKNYPFTQIFEDLGSVYRKMTEKIDK